MKRNEIFLWLSFCDKTVPSKSIVPSLWPWPLTHEGQIFLNWLWIDYEPISILYEFKIDISTNSREIKYRNVGRIHRHTHRHTLMHPHRQTGWKQYLATPSKCEVINKIIYWHKSRDMLSQVTESVFRIYTTTRSVPSLWRCYILVGSLLVISQ